MRHSYGSKLLCEAAATNASMPPVSTAAAEIRAVAVETGGMEAFVAAASQSSDEAQECLMVLSRSEIETKEKHLQRRTPQEGERAEARRQDCLAEFGQATVSGGAEYLVSRDSLGILPGGLTAREQWR